MENLVSVIIPTYNREKTIIRSINSVLNQTYKNIEILVIDDGSVDNTKKLINELNNSSVHYLYQHNQGQNSARNNGIAHSSGDFLFFLDSDDEWLPQMVEKHLAVYKNNPDVYCVYNNVVSFVNKRPANTGTDFTISGNIYKEALIQGYISSMIGLSFKRDCLSTITGFDPKFSNSDDDDLCLRLAKHFKFFLIPDVLAIVHDDGGNRITGDKIQYLDGWFQLYTKHFDDILLLCGQSEINKKFFSLAKRYEKLGLVDKSKDCLKYVTPHYKPPKNYNAKKIIKNILSFFIPHGIIKLYNRLKERF